jgi:hypothetical protein
LWCDVCVYHCKITTLRSKKVSERCEMATTIKPACLLLLITRFRIISVFRFNVWLGEWCFFGNKIKWEKLKQNIAIWHPLAIRKTSAIENFNLHKIENSCQESISFNKRKLWFEIFLVYKLENHASFSLPCIY